MSLVPNQQLFEYRIVRALGQGAFGTVYLAHDTLLDRPVAIKELTLTAQTDEIAFQRFLQEARAAGGLNHPHIVTVHALKVAEPSVYLVMEYLPGGSLRALLEQRGRLPVEDAARVAADVCDGLAAAHAKGIVHRDVKPENIMLTEDGRAKVGDFGIAHVPRGAGGTSLTQAGFQPGTLLYMSPEQIRGQVVDGRSDVYQVGALLYEMLTGRHYVDLKALERRARETAASNAALFQARLFELLSKVICEQDPEGVCKSRLEIPEWIGEVVAAALAKDRQERPPLADLGQALQRERVIQPIPGMPPSAGEIDLTEEHFNRGVYYVNQGYWNEAIQEFRAALTVNPDHAAAHADLGMVYVQQGLLDEAICECQAALHINPNHAEAHLSLGLVNKQQGHFEKAIQAFQAALDIDPSLTEAHLRLGEIFVLRGYLEKAIREFQVALHINPKLAEAHGRLGDAYARQRHWDSAVAEYQAALRVDPNHLEAHIGLGMVSAEQGQWDDAIREYKAAMWINPRHVTAHINLGAVYAEQGRWDDAIREYQAALRINPNLAIAYFNLGEAYRQQGRLDDAIREFQAALRIKPEYPEVHCNLGLVYGAQGRREEEIQEYQAALQIAPDDPEVRYNLAVAYAQHGSIRDAVREANFALRLGFEQAGQLLARLAQQMRGTGPASSSPPWAVETTNLGQSMHNCWIVTCIGLRGDVGTLCNTVIAIALDMGSVAFRCPICNTLYIVDPYQDTDPETTDAGFGLVEVEGHRIEIVHSANVQAMQAVCQEYEKFLVTKVGSLERVYVAQVDSVPGQTASDPGRHGVR